MTTFPGIQCVEPDDASPEIFYSNGRAFNDNANADTELECAIARPESDVAGPLSAVVRVNDAHTNENLTCFIRSCDALGTNCSMSMTASSSNVGIQSMTLGSVNTFINGYAYLSCSVPNKQNGNRSGVISYRTFD